MKRVIHSKNADGFTAASLLSSFHLAEKVNHFLAKFWHMSGSPFLRSILGSEALCSWGKLLPDIASLSQRGVFCFFPFFDLSYHAHLTILLLKDPNQGQLDVERELFFVLQIIGTITSLPRQE